MGDNKEIINQITEVAENLKFNVRVEENEDNVTFTFSKYSPFGQDFSFDIEVDNDEDIFDNLIYEIDEFYENYDVSYEAYLWLDEWGHGKNGAPYEMIDVYKDFKACEEYIDELAKKLKEIEI